MSLGDDFKKIICPLPADAAIPSADQEVLSTRMDPGQMSPLSLISKPNGEKAFGVIVDAKTNPWMGITDMDGNPVVCRGIKFEAHYIDWSHRPGTPRITTLCPDGSGRAGSGWHYRFCPRLTLVVGINGVQCSAPNPCDNPRDVFSVAGPGLLTMAFNDYSAAGSYKNNDGAGIAFIL